MQLSRRGFVRGSAGALGAAAVSGGVMAEALTAQSQGGWSGYNDALVLDNLGGILNPNLPYSTDVPSTLDPRALRDAIASGVTAINTTIGFVAGDEEPFEYSVRSVGRSNRQIENHSDQLLKVLSGEDILRAKREGKIGIIQGFQNAAMMGEDASRVTIFAELGVRIIQLTYNGLNQLGAGSMVPDNGGLTAFGRDVVAELNANNMVIDLSHSGERTCLDAIEASQEPICITHTGCQALADLPRNKTDRELRMVAEKGGAVGIYFMPFLREDGMSMAADLIDHIEHAINVCGEDHVGIGTDGGLTAVDDIEAARERTRRSIERRRAQGISAKGEIPGVVTFLPDLSGPTQFQRLADKLQARGHSSARIEKILGLNFFNYYRRIWRGSGT